MLLHKCVARFLIIIIIITTTIFFFLFFVLLVGHWSTPSFSGFLSIYWSDACFCSDKAIVLPVLEAMMTKKLFVYFHALLLFLLVFQCQPVCVCEMHVLFCFRVSLIYSLFVAFSLSLSERLTHTHTYRWPVFAFQF